MQAVPTGLRTHSQRVCSFYKRAVRNYESWFLDYEEWRLASLRLRKQLDDNKNIKDLRIAKKLLIEAEAELTATLHPQPCRFATAPGGCAYDRYVVPPDWVLDMWEPMEKAAYPKYFTLREKRKLEYKQLFDKQYPDAPKHFEADH